MPKRSTPELAARLAIDAAPYLPIPSAIAAGAKLAAITKAAPRSPSLLSSVFSSLF
jgi:hypothetical protein